MNSRKFSVAILFFVGLVICLFQYQIFTLQSLVKKCRSKKEHNEQELGPLKMANMQYHLGQKQNRPIASSFDKSDKMPSSSMLNVNRRDDKVMGSYDNSLVVLYNRVPKTGSTSFMKIIYDLAKENHFNTLYINVTAPGRTMNLGTQAKFVKNVTEWNEIKPAFFHGHLPYLNFAQHGSPLKPIYINVIRQPLERMASYYYFLRYGDNFRPHLKRQRMGDKTTIDECVLMREKDCHPSQMWLQIKYFCGHQPHCSIPGNEWALKQAKRHLSDQYFLVGVTEKLEKFIKLLEFSLPRFFTGATKRYLKGGGVFLRKTVTKPPISNDTITFFKNTKVWRMENEFYQFALKNFNQKYNSIFKKLKKGASPGIDTFFYQKIKKYSNY